jgi:RNA polymerase sigma-70 factor (ECF subfamily)
LGSLLIRGWLYGNLSASRIIYKVVDELNSCLPAAWLAGENGLRDNDLLAAPTRVTEAFPFMTQSSLAELIRRGKEGDPRALEEIYERYRGPLFSLAVRHARDRAAAEDILQDAFIKVLTHLDDVQNEETFSAWVYRIALNTCYSHLRSRRSRDDRTVALSQVEGKKDEAVYDGHEASVAGPIEEAVASLPRKLRTVFVLHDMQGFKHEEVARLLGVTVGTSKSQLFKARLKMRKFLKAKTGLSPEVKP